MNLGQSREEKSPMIRGLTYPISISCYFSLSRQIEYLSYVTITTINFIHHLLRKRKVLIVY